jgi:GT2 family glycosyltransferase
MAPPIYRIMTTSSNSGSVVLSIVIVNWHSAAFLEQCLHTIYRETKDLSFEVIVIDNATFDGSAEIVRRSFSEVRFIQSNDNLGFSKGNNLAYRDARGEFVLFLNPDTEILDGAIQKLVACLQADPKAGVVGPKLLNTDQSIQTSCVQSFPTILNQAFDTEILRRLFPHSSLWGVRSLYEDQPGPAEVDVISGASLMIRREAFEAAGLFSSNYFMYAEDVDLCFKIHSAGWKVLYLGDAVVIHHGGQSSCKKAESNFAIVMNRESLYSFFVIRRGRLYAIAFRAITCLVAAVRLLLLGTLFVFSFGIHDKGLLPGAVRKWRSVFRWAVGLESIAH